MSGDQRILSIVAEISECSDREIPALLIKLQGIVESAPSGSDEAGRLKRQIYDYDLLPVLLLALKQDFSHVKNNWNTGVNLCQFCYNVLMAISPEGDVTFQQHFLPESVTNIMILARRIQDRFLLSLQPDTYVTEASSNKILDCFRAILEILQHLLQSYPNLCVQTINSPWFLQLFISDDDNTGVYMLNFLKFIVTLKTDLLAHVDEKLLFSILDEMTYTLSVTNSDRWAGTTIKCVLKICQVFPSAIDSISQRYKGLKLLISKWSGRPSLIRDLSQLISLLDAGSAQRAEMECYHEAALKIQAVWRSHATRMTLMRKSSSAAKIQKLFRNYKLNRENVDSREKARKALEHQIALRRQRMFREKLEKEIQLMETLPAPIVKLHVIREQNAAAVKIQANWRGLQQRKKLPNALKNHNRIQAAIRIQRGVRKWIARLESKRKEPPAYQRPPGLTDERRVQVQQLIQDWRDQHPPKERSRDEQEELHAHAQTLIQRHVFMSKQIRRKEFERSATLARIDADVEMLLSAPKMHESSTVADSGRFVCHSIPIANRAKQLHIEQLRRLRQPWWKQLQYFDEGEDETMYVVDKQDVLVVDGKVM